MTGPGRLPGHASPEGTARFAERAGREDRTDPGHFRTFLDLTFSSLGMGTYLGRPDEPTDRRVTAAAVTSVSSGAVNVLDSAINYRNGRGEQAIGQALRSLLELGVVRRDELFVATKNGYTADRAALARLEDEGKIRGDEVASECNCLSVPFLAEELPKSLASLGVDTIDLLYLHNVTDEHLPLLGKEAFLERLRSAFDFLERCRSEGKIRYYGLATWDTLRLPANASGYLALEEALTVAQAAGGTDHGFRFVQFPFNMAMPEAALRKNQPVEEELRTLFDAARALGLGTFSSVPLLQGKLPPREALQFARGAPGHLAPLVGHKDPQHVTQNLEVARVPPLEPEEFEGLLHHLTQPD